MSYSVRNKDTYDKVDYKSNNQMINNKSGSNYNGSKERAKSNFAQDARNATLTNRPLSANNPPKKISTSGISTLANPNTTKFEVYDSHTLIVKRNSDFKQDKPRDSRQTGNLTSQNNANTPKSRTQQIFQSQQPNITVKPHYTNNMSNSNLYINDGMPKINRLPNFQSETGRSLSGTVIRSTNHKPTIRQLPATNNPYDSINRHRNYKPKPISTDSTRYNSLPKQNKNTKPIKQFNTLPTDVDSSLKRVKIPPHLKIAPEITNNSSQDNLDGNNNTANSINFSSTLAKAGTHSPPIKRRSSSLLSHSPSIKMPSRFASRSTINDIYTQKNKKFYFEQYKLVAAEILRENLAKAELENNVTKNSEPVKELNDIKPFDVESSSSSSLSTSDSETTSSYATDGQVSISSIPKDDIPLNVPKPAIVEDTVSTTDADSNLMTKLETVHLSVEDEDASNVEQMLDNNSFKEDINVKLPEISNKTLEKEKSKDKTKEEDEDGDDEDEEIESADEYDLENDFSSTNSMESEEENIEELRKMFLPLYEIERMDDDFLYHQDLAGLNPTDPRKITDSELVSSMLLPDHQHSQSFRVENTSQASQVDVFVHKESLQKAKDCLHKNPSKGILSKRLTGISEPIESAPRIRIDPHILLLEACLEPDYELVKSLLPLVPNISRSTIDGITALHNAVCSGDAKLVLHLLQQGANVNAADADGWTALHCSACCNNKQISTLLVEHGASLFAQTLSDFEIPSQKCSKSQDYDSQCEEYLFYEQESLGVKNNGVIYALFDYTPQHSDELPLVPNQLLKVLDTNPNGESGWFLAQDITNIDQMSTGKNSNMTKGFIPAAYVSCYQLILPQDFNATYLYNGLQLS